MGERGKGTTNVTVNLKDEVVREIDKRAVTMERPSRAGWIKGAIEEKLNKEKGEE